jgi:homopolymeric O-antigen transport system permease protein
MLDAIRELRRHRDLLYMMTWREVKVKYKQSVMGMLWAVLMPMMIICAGLVLRVAFTAVSGAPLTAEDVLAVAVKAAPWAFFVAALRFGTNSLIANVNLVTRVYLPRVVFPLAAVLSQLVDFAVAMAVVAIVAVAAGIGITVHVLWIPLLLTGVIVLATAGAIFCSATGLFFRDVKYLVEVFLTFAIFFTPVFYDASLLGRWAPVLLLNPVSPLLEGIAGAVVFHRSPPIPWLLYSIGAAALLLWGSLAVFRKLEPYFAESI